MEETKDLRPEDLPWSLLLLGLALLRMPERELEEEGPCHEAAVQP